MSWIRYLIAFALFMHGLAHFSGFFAAWTKADMGYPAKPWLFSKNVTLKSPPGKVFGLLLPVAALALAASGVGLALGHGPGWRWRVPVCDPALERSDSRFSLIE